MTVRKPQCPKCNSTSHSVDASFLRNPAKTMLLNCVDADLTCIDCGHKWSQHVVDPTLHRVSLDTRKKNYVM